ncbi:MAG: phosphatase PAP2 family protein [Fimbriimonadaceae bacterium]|nr:phosphatase PAP2 family protein [Chitinophagales bacterium]
MKKNLIPVAISISIVFFVFNSCNPDIPRYTAFESYVYSTVDSTGGEWEQIYLTGTSLVTLPAPEPITSDSYLNELEEVKNYNLQITDDQQSAIDFWGNNTIVKWIEITQELVAKYNLPPAPNDTSGYDVPDAVFPDTYPYFPFANPPYACRAYAYLTTAMYDALIAAWHYKYEYNRPAPYKVDTEIIPSYPDNNIPSYPSEDAVIARVAENMLGFLFPLETEYISEMANEVRNTRLWSGMNVQSDINAGDSLGYLLTEIFIGRAKNDSTKFAQVEEDEYIEIELQADALWSGSWNHWENLETPQRPIGITPKFGRVNTWWVDSIETMRPPPPPLTGSPEYVEAVNELKGYTDHLPNDKRDIAFFWGDGFSTYTPAGHWDKIAIQYSLQDQLSPLRTARVLAYLNTAMMDAGISCWDAKYYYMYPRPAQENEDVKCLFGIPNFPSYTSGHSTFSGAAATVLGYMFPENAGSFNAWAHDASESRIYARIHFRFDCEAGLTVGNNIGTLAVNAAMVDGSN